MKKLAIVFAVGAAAADGRFRRQRRRQFGEGKDLDWCHSILNRHQRAQIATDIGAAIITTIATGATVITGRITTAMATTPRVTAITAADPAITAAAPA